MIQTIKWRQKYISRQQLKLDGHIPHICNSIPLSGFNSIVVVVVVVEVVVSDSSELAKVFDNSEFRCCWFFFFLPLAGCLSHVTVVVVVDH